MLETAERQKCGCEPELPLRFPCMLGLPSTPHPSPDRLLSLQFLQSLEESSPVARLLRLEREAGAMGEMGGALVTQTR